MPRIWSDIKHHLIIRLGLTSRQHTNSIFQISRKEFICRIFPVLKAIFTPILQFYEAEIYDQITLIKLACVIQQFLPSKLEPARHDSRLNFGKSLTQETLNSESLVLKKRTLDLDFSNL